MFRRIFPALGFIVLVFALTFNTQAQQGTAAISGVVTDQTGAVIPGATVTLRNPHTGVVLKTTTASGGGYASS
jgi:hypothetical protein